MNVALLNIRFEISDDSDYISYMPYKAKGLSLTKASYSSVLSEDKLSVSTQDFLDQVRGQRKLQDICIETYFEKDYDIKVIEQFVQTTSMSSPVKAAEACRDVHEKPSTSETLLTGAASSLSKELPEKDVHVKKAHVKGAVEKRKQPSLEKKLSLSERDDSEVVAALKKGHISGSIEADGVVRPKSQSPPPKGVSLLQFYSGNPMVEKVKGILHIYKDNHMTSLAADVPRSELICMLAVPAKYTIHDLLEFNAQCIKGIEYMRIIRDSTPNQYMVLIKFRDQAMADEYYDAYNNTLFNSIETDVCHLVYVGQVEMLKESENACMAIPGMTELPNCPVCLERMEESVAGILTILCNHSFHVDCLHQWFDTSCPVCRYCQTPEEVADNRCMKCGSHESLWICLICGNIGCGRYVGLHAYRHFQETQHTYAMELGNNKVWDYIGDNYVHRLVQNKSDGKLVQVDEGGNPVRDEKVDSLNLEYTYLLTNQLESQRLYFEEKMNEVERTILEKVHVLEEEKMNLTKECSHFHAELELANKEKQQSEKKCVQLQSRMKKVLTDVHQCYLCCSCSFV
ncbi:BRCA1-associated protein-like isoform X4 [Dreissena polymorpha]|uniref:BRCA1-associated protein-like isoform X4 n=1 Tax=Dreissena polymorpha TaxID=45954 RepID=UPI002263B555|nr:BRCA1-associated protein-like isoform X4 [Dreissena polymorpha]